MAVTENDLLVGPVVPAAATTVISLDYYFEDITHLEVYKDGSETPLTLGVDYTATLPTEVDATDGFITLLVAADGTNSYAIYLKQPLQRSADLQFRGDLRSPVLNLELNRIWRAIQGINTDVLRSFRFSRNSNIPGPIETLTAASRQNRVLKFSSDGTTLEIGPTETDIANAEADATAAASSASAAAASATEAALYDGPWRDHVQALLDDETLTYTAGQVGTVTTGDIIRTRAEGFAYEVAASGATDHHVTTAGGVKLYVLPEKGGYNVKAFGAVADAVEKTGSMASGSAVLTDAGGGFTAADVGKAIVVEGAAATTDNPFAAGRNLFTTIASFNSATSVTLTDAATATVANAIYVYGTDDTANVQKAYDAAAAEGGGVISWSFGQYKIDGKILFPRETETKLNNSKIWGNNQTLFETGYWNGSTMLTTVGTSGSDFTTAVVFNAIIGGGRIAYTSLAFKLEKFLWGCRLEDIVCRHGNMIDGNTCFYSAYKELILTVPSVFKRDVTWNITAGSAVATLPNADTDFLAVGQTIASLEFPVGTTITAIGAADSGGAGLTNVTLDNNAANTRTAGASYSGYCSTDDTSAGYKFRGNCSNIVIEKCGGVRKWIVFDFEGVDGASLISNDISFSVYGHKWGAANIGVTLTGTYTERVFQWLHECSDSTNTNLTITMGRYYQCAGALTAGASGHIEGTMQLVNETFGNSGHTPYGIGNNTLIDVTSPNADMLVLGGVAALKTANIGTKSRFQGQYGLSFANVGIDDVETLDWYEEGTFTPVFSPAGGAFTSVTYDANNTYGTYQRVGNRVHVQIRMRTTAITVGTATGNLSIAGLPFANSASQSVGTVTLAGPAFSWTTAGPQTCLIDNAQSSILLYRYGTTAATNITVANLTTGGNGNGLALDITYRV